jgi:FkbM family methyltransferase
MISRIFPEAQFVLIEPNKRILYKTNENISTINPRPLLLDVAIGANPGTGFLNIWGDDLKTFEGASLLSHIKGNAENKIKTEITTIDMISKSTGFIPDFVKLDLQGTELDALRGAESILERTELFVVEFGCLEAYKNRTTPRDLLNIMYENGYSLYDITDLIYRPFDGALVGGDFFFIKNNSLLKAYKDYN